MPPNIPLSERLPRRYSANPSDVFCMVKHNLCDHGLSQPALLCLPGDEQAGIITFFKEAVRHQGILAEIDSDRRADLVELAGALDLYPQFARASAYLRSLAGIEPRTRLPVQPLNFIARGGIQQSGLVYRLPPRQPLPNPHHLRVRFHRDR